MAWRRWSCAATRQGLLAELPPLGRHHIAHPPVATTPDSRHSNIRRYQFRPPTRMPWRALVSAATTTVARNFRIRATLTQRAASTSKSSPAASSSDEMRARRSGDQHAHVDLAVRAIGGEQFGRSAAG